MMMMGEGAHASPWQHAVSGAEGGGYTGAGDDVAPYLLSALRDYLPSNEAAAAAAAGVGEDDEDAAAYAWDEFRMYEFKVRLCARGRSHDWTDCPFAHTGEKARRRDPRRYCYSGTACPDFRKGGCKRGDACQFAHGVFECWLHPARYRTQACKDGTACHRRVCFFAHTPDQLRALPQHQQGSSPRSVVSSPLAESYDGSPLRRQAFESYLSKSMTSSSPASSLVSPPRSPPSESPPVSPDQLRSLPQHQQGSSPRSVASSPLAESYDGSLLRRQAFESYLSKSMMLSSPTSTLVSPPRSSPSESPDAAGGFRHGSWPRVGPPVNDVLTSLRQLRLGSPKLAPSGGSFLAGYNTAFESPKSPVGQYSFPSTPTRSSLVTVTIASGATMTMEPMDLGLIAEEQPVERVESGRALRAKVFERLSKEATVCNDTIAAAAVEVPTSAAPDVGWVSDLIN